MGEEERAKEVRSLSDLLEKLKKEVSFGVALLSVRSRELWDSRELGVEIRRLKRLRRQRIEELGEAAHKIFCEAKTEELEELRKLSDRVLEVEREIQAKEIALAEVRRRAQETLARVAQWEKRTETCHCGAQWVPEAKYCHLCGKPIPQETPSFKGELQEPSVEPPPVPPREEGPAKG
jgi:DNA repair exonuclease SbcCD ATPase subunit